MKDILKIIIDEIFDNDEMRILWCIKKKSWVNSKEWDDFRIWNDVRENIVTSEDLRDLLGWKRIGMIAEGRVFLKTDQEVIDITKDVRKKVKERYMKLLAREGK